MGRTSRRRSQPRLYRATREYESSLRKIAKHVGNLVDGFDPLDAAQLPSLTALLRAYADALGPWARMVAGKMIGEVDGRDRDMWRALGREISSGVAHMLSHTPIGNTVRQRLDEQVSLITSLPVDAGKRVHELTLKGLEDSTRASEIAKEILRSGEVTESRAILIARTEVCRTATAFTEARARFVGSTHYIWRTSLDGAVRPGHQAMEGKVCSWTDPPEVNENGRIMKHHPGEIWNCRCWPEPIVTDDTRRRPRP